MFKKLWRFIRNVFVYWVVMLAGVAFYVLFPAVTGWFDAPVTGIGLGLAMLGFAVILWPVVSRVRGWMRF